MDNSVWRFRVIMTIYLLAVVLAQMLYGQQPVKRILAQDSTLNNLADPPGYRSVKLGTLGGVLKVGNGSQPLILIPGLGFSANVFIDFMAGLSDMCRMYAVTLPGFGGTAAPPSPGEKTSLGEQTWTNGALQAIEKLIKDEGIEKPIIVGHWLTGTQLALRLAMKHPDKIKAVIILAGSARMTATDSARAAMINTLEKRVAVNDKYMAPRWFKTVTRETWDDNNFLPGDYAINPVRALRLWREAASPELHVWVRYLCEFNSQDISLEMEKITVPILMVQPDLSGIYHDPGNNYMESFINASWGETFRKNPKITVVTIPDARVCLWFDQPEKVKKTVEEFLKRSE